MSRLACPRIPDTVSSGTPATQVHAFRDVVGDLDAVPLLPHAPVHEEVPHGPVRPGRPIEVHRELVRDAYPSMPGPLLPPVGEVLRHPMDDTLQDAIVVVGLESVQASQDVHGESGPDPIHEALDSKTPV